MSTLSLTIEAGDSELRCSLTQSRAIREARI